MVLKKEIEVTKEADELMQGVLKTVLALRDALGDGFDLQKDFPVIVAAIMTDLLPAIQGLDKLGEEAKENWVALVNAFAVGGVKLAYEFFQKDLVVNPIKK